MPWSQNDYPDSMKNLPDHVRNKAIEIANALLEERYSEGRAIAIGIAQARKYFEEDDDRPEYHIEPNGTDWVLKKKDGTKAIMRENTKEDLLEKAKSYVNEHKGMLVIHKSDGAISETLYD